MLRIYIINLMDSAHTRMNPVCQYVEAKEPRESN